MSRINDLAIDFLAQQRIAVAGVTESPGTAPTADLLCPAAAYPSRSWRIRVKTIGKAERNVLHPRDLSSPPDLLTAKRATDKHPCSLPGPVLSEENLSDKLQPSRPGSAALPTVICALTPPRGCPTMS